jgi:3-oxoadipate enol-lactonase
MSDSQITSFDGAKLNVRVEGPEGAPVVVLAHSLGGSIGLWDETAAELSKRYRVIRYDARGHGGSGAPGGDYSVEMMAKDALAVMDALGIGRANFVGLSMGGMIGMWLAANRPERIEKLVLANTTARIPATDMLNGWIAKAKAEGLGELAPPIITGWLHQGFRDASPARTQALVDAMAGMTRDGFAGAVAVLRDSDQRENLAKIAAPTLVIAGVEDGPRGDAAAQALADGIKGATRANLPAAAHLSPVENPSAFAKAVMDFVG